MLHKKYKNKEGVPRGGDARTTAGRLDSPDDLARQPDGWTA